jgi:hypothetical protein
MVHSCATTTRGHCLCPLAGALHDYAGTQQHAPPCPQRAPDAHAVSSPNRTGLPARTTPSAPVSIMQMMHVVSSDDHSTHNLLFLVPSSTKRNPHPPHQETQRHPGLPGPGRVWHSSMHCANLRIRQTQ